MRVLSIFCIREGVDDFRTMKIEGSILRQCDDLSKHQSDECSYTKTRPHLRKVSIAYSRSATRNSRAGLPDIKKAMVVVFFKL